MRRVSAGLRQFVGRGSPVLARFELYLLGVVVLVGLLITNVVWTSVYAVGATLLAIGAVFSRRQMGAGSAELAVQLTVVVNTGLLGVGPVLL